MKNVEFAIHGLDQIKDKLARLDREVGDAAGRRALRKAANVIAAAAKENALLVDDPNTARRIRDNIRLQFASRHYKQTGDLMYRIGVSTRKGRIPKGNPDEGAKGNTPHWHLIEIGTEHSRAKPFLRPALAEKRQQAIDTLMHELDREIAKELYK